MIALTLRSVHLFFFIGRSISGTYLAEFAEFRGVGNALATGAPHSLHIISPTPSQIAAHAQSHLGVLLRYDKCRPVDTLKINFRSTPLSLPLLVAFTHPLLAPLDPRDHLVYCIDDAPLCPDPKIERLRLLHGL